MASVIAGSLYAIVSLDPVTELDGCVVYCCLPLDMDPYGGIDERTRYVTLLIAPPGVMGSDLFGLAESSRPYSSQWITYVWDAGAVGVTA